MDDLITACIGGDQNAWDQFVEQYARVVFVSVSRVLRQVVQQGGDPLEDIVQDVFVRLVRDDFRLLRSYDSSRGSFATYLAVIADSTARDVIRRKRIFTQPLSNQTEDIAACRDRIDSVEIPPGLLSPRQFLVIKLLFGRQMEVVQVAHVLGITPQTVRSAKHKAISKLRDHLADK